MQLHLSFGFAETSRLERDLFFLSYFPPGLFFAAYNDGESMDTLGPKQEAAIYLANSMLWCRFAA